MLACKTVGERIFLWQAAMGAPATAEAQVTAKHLSLILVFKTSLGNEWITIAMDSQFLPKLNRCIGLMHMSP